MEGRLVAVLWIGACSPAAPNAAGFDPPEGNDWHCFRALHDDPAVRFEWSSLCTRTLAKCDDLRSRTRTLWDVGLPAAVKPEPPPRPPPGEHSEDSLCAIDPDVCAVVNASVEHREPTGYSACGAAPVAFCTEQRHELGDGEWHSICFATRRECDRYREAPSRHVVMRATCVVAR